MVTKKINNLIYVLSIFSFVFMFSIKVFAATLDPTIPTFDYTTFSLNTDGTATFVPPAYSGGWKRFDIQLLKRVSSVTTVGTSTVVVYSYKTSGTVKYVDATETSYDFNFPSVGYYQFQIRGENLEGNYGAWARMSGGETADLTYEGLAVDEDHISMNNNSSGSGSSTYGPGTVQTGSLPYGYQYAIVGPNGQIIYNYGGNQSNYYPYNNNSNSQSLGPGYYINNANGTSTFVPNTGISGYPQVPAPNTSGIYNNSTTNPNYYNGNTSGYSPSVSSNTAIGWNVDNYGRFYHQGNGVILRGTWYLIDGSYYRFNDSGYLLVNTWYKDTSTGAWYYLSNDGKMLTGWQKVNNVWYYFKPENGNGYGTMYMNTVLQITDSLWGTGYYAFDSNGACVMNGWYDGHYYDSSGKRTN